MLVSSRGRARRPAARRRPDRRGPGSPTNTVLTPNSSTPGGGSARGGCAASPAWWRRANAAAGVRPRKPLDPPPGVVPVGPDDGEVEHRHGHLRGVASGLRRSATAAPRACGPAPLRRWAGCRRRRARPRSAACGVPRSRPRSPVVAPPAGGMPWSPAGRRAGPSCALVPLPHRAWSVSMHDSSRSSRSAGGRKGQAEGLVLALPPPGPETRRTLGRPRGRQGWQRFSR